MQNRQESHDDAPGGWLWFPSLDSASSDSCIVHVFRKSAYPLRTTVPNLSIGALLWGLQCSLLCCFDESDRLNAAFFSLLRSRLTRSKKPIPATKSRKCRGGYFRRDNRDQLVQGFQTGPISTSTGAKWSCARSVLAIITSVSSENKLAGSKKSTRKHRRQSTGKNQLTWLRSPPRWDAESPRSWPKTTVWPWCKRCDEILRCRIIRFW